MSLYTTLASLSQTAASNAADGSVDAPSTIDQQTNLLASFSARLRDGDLATAIPTVASAATLVLDGTASGTAYISGTTTITAITLAEGSRKILRFAGALTLTNGASLVLPGAANITTAAGDYAIFVGRSGGVVECVEYQVAAYPPKPASSLGASGYQKLPNGMIIQWGSTTGPAGSTGITFPIAFPTACYSLTPVISASTTTSIIYSVTVNSISTTGGAVTRTFYNGSSVGAASEAVYWIAVGN